MGLGDAGAGPAILHAGLIASRLGGAWRGALIVGPSGAGKSDLALRALASEGFRLVADDRTIVFVSEGRLFGRAPAPLFGLIEQRGLGVIAIPAIPSAAIALVVRCLLGPAAVERMPAPGAEKVLGIDVPMVALRPFEPSAPAKLRRALEHLGRGAARAYQATLDRPV